LDLVGEDVLPQKSITRRANRNPGNDSPPHRVEALVIKKQYVVLGFSPDTT
jgi:hypothetical protein